MWTYYNYSCMKLILLDLAGHACCGADKFGSLVGRNVGRSASWTAHVPLLGIVPITLPFVKRPEVLS